MNIIIVGCGKVGYTLVEQLSNEEHNIVVVDKNPDKVRYIADDLDTMGVIGNGVSYKTLQEAGIATASAKPNRDKVAKVSKETVKKIAEIKMQDMNAASLETAMSMVAGTARSMGIVVED